MPPHTHPAAPSGDLGTRLMAMSAGRRVLWAAAGVVLLWLAVWWALAFEAKAAPPAAVATGAAP
ncbi:hypothetical protein [Vineibacter terrae]|uniref:hypothetical protein n=1 Tax=Vineibacter terrae TaxID=2586908 RepID=UPI002E350CD8|nr:hypothetical protein [Vineibacter terrae]HEX2890024.1 hypothetical protein [Vineibacter terrae]